MLLIWMVYIDYVNRLVLMETKRENGNGYMKVFHGAGEWDGIGIRRGCGEAIRGVLRVVDVDGLGGLTAVKMVKYMVKG